MEELQNHLTTQMEATNLNKNTLRKRRTFDPHGYEERLL